MQPHVTFTQNAAANGVQESSWIQCDAWCNGPVSVQVTVIGTATYTVMQTLDDPNDPASPVPVANVVWFGCPNTNLVNSTVSAQTSYTSAPRYIKFVQTAGSGIVQMTVSQNGAVPQ
jgi:hypothetical protein